jgi:ADP-ribose pyrophosphatase
MARKEKLVFRGQIFNVYQWRQRMFDGSYKTFERVERPSSAQVIAIVGNKIAIGVQTQPDRPQFKGFFGGRVEKGESPLQAAKRELLEETGMKAKKWKLVKGFSRPAHKITFGIYLYAAIGCKKVAKPHLESGERIRIKLISLKELLNWRNETARIGPDIALYFTELRYNARSRKRLAQSLGLPS